MNRAMFQFFLLFLFCGCAPVVFAQQGCPPGYYPIGGGNAGWNDCAPMGNVENPPNPGPQWETRWGGIATGYGVFGASTSAKSKSEAKKKAIKECKAMPGAKKCKIVALIHNQCVALAWGDTGNSIYRSPDLQDAEKGAITECSSHAQNCRILHSSCSYPQRAF